MRNYHSLRTAFTLGTGLTALFLVLRCSVPGRDYSELGIGDNPGSAGQGAGGDGVLHGSAGQGGEDGLGGQGGLDGLGGVGGQGGGEPPPEPIPCVEPSNDAGVGDAGSTDAGSDAGSENPGSEDAGVPDQPCACVDGFIRAVDADGDGVGTRACAVAPGLDCDDDDAAVTHNSCNGCTALPNTVGEDCLDCGAYVCDGTDAVVCATKPDAVVVDPDCRCLDALIIARDTDGDGAGTRLCEFNPGIDCNDGDNSFTTNQCGGCAELPGVAGGGCNECGVYQCSGTALVCVPNPAEPAQCLGPATRQSCINNGYWDTPEACTNVCYGGRCVDCTPGTFMCDGASLYKCLESASYGTISWNSWDSCSSSTPVCNANLGKCTGSLLLPRDESFEVVPLRRPGLPWHELLNTASDSDYG